MLKNWAVDPERVSAPESAAGLKAAGKAATAELRMEIPRFLTVLREVLDLRSEILGLKDGYPGLEKEVNALIGPQFLRTTPLERFWQLPRYLRAKKLRAQRWKKNPLKDADRARRLAPYLSAPAHLRWLVEEYRVSLFAQELGTSEPVSAVKLEQAIAAVRSKETAAAAAKPEKAPPAVLRLDAPEAKSKPLKSLTALDKFFT